MLRTSLLRSYRENCSHTFHTFRNSYLCRATVQKHCKDPNYSIFQIDLQTHPLSRFARLVKEKREGEPTIQIYPEDFLDACVSCLSCQHFEPSSVSCRSLRKKLNLLLEKAKLHKSTSFTCSKLHLMGRDSALQACFP